MIKKKKLIPYHKTKTLLPLPETKTTENSHWEIIIEKQTSIKQQ